MTNDDTQKHKHRRRQSSRSWKLFPDFGKDDKHHTRLQMIRYNGQAGKLFVPPGTYLKGTATSQEISGCLASNREADEERYQFHLICTHTRLQLHIWGTIRPQAPSTHKHLEAEMMFGSQWRIILNLARRSALINTDRLETGRESSNPNDKWSRKMLQSASGGGRMVWIWAAAVRYNGSSSKEIKASRRR